MDQPIAPSMQRRRLSAELRRARDDAKMTQQQVAEELGWSLSKLIRIEGGRVRVSRTDLKALLSQYGLDDSSHIGRLVRLADGGKALRWAEYREVLHPEFRRYLEYEDVASRLVSFQPAFLPGLLQTEDYARHAIEALAPPEELPETLERQHAVRMMRQRKLGPGGTEFHFILDEAVVRRIVGDPAVMRRQLERLVDLSRQPNIKLQIVPFSCGMYRGMTGSFTILQFPDGVGDDLLFLENGKGTLLVKEDRKLIQHHWERFDGLERIATDPDSLDKVIREMSRGR